jgi:hypothetical protein
LVHDAQTGKNVPNQRKRSKWSYRVRQENAELKKQKTSSFFPASYRNDTQTSF